MNRNHPALNNLAGYLCSHLPDSISQRRQILTDLLRVLPAKHPMRERVTTMLTFLESHGRQQLEFSELFPFSLQQPSAAQQS